MTDETSPTPHRAPRRARRATIVAVVSALLLAAIGTGFLWSQRGHERKQLVAAPPTRVVTHTARPAPTPTPTPTPKPKPKPVIPHQKVAAAAPTSFVYQGKGFTIRATVCGMANVRPLDPPGEQHHTVCWVDEGFGVAPGTTSGTTYVLGHSWAEDSLEVLNNISLRATKQILKATPKTVSGVPTYPVTRLDGDTLTLHTPKGTLVYKVRSAFGVPKDQAAYVKPLMDQQTKHRIVLITCAERNGTDYDYNVVLNAYLYSSKRA